MARSVPLVALLATGCGIPLASVTEGAFNTCESSSDCAAGGVCAAINGVNSCVSTSSDLPGLILEIRPPADASFGPNVSYLIDVATQGMVLQDENPSGQVQRFDPRFAELASIDGHVQLPLTASYCGMTTKFKRVSQFLGLPDQEYITTTDYDPDNPNGYTFHIEVPEGFYHIYMVPDASETCEVPPPPIFFRDQTITVNSELNIVVAPPRRFEGKLYIPGSVNIDGWSLELVEPVDGNVISQVQSLQKTDWFHANFDLLFDWTEQSKFIPLIRLRPPEGSAMPTVHWDLSGVALNGTTENLNLSLIELNAVPRHVEGQVLDKANAPVVASVQILSDEISGDTTSTAKYRLETKTDEYGFFKADLPPGRYLIRVHPTADPTKAAAEPVLEFPPSSECYCGQTFTVPETSKLRGRALGPAGESIDPANAVVIPSLSGAVQYLDRVLAIPSLRPRQASIPLTQGAFSLDVDPGEFDLSVRPQDGSRYPWLVRSLLTIPSADMTPVTDLGLSTVPYPTILYGTVRDPLDQVVPGTLVRAWLPIQDPNETSKLIGVIQIGETTAQSDGSYLLPVPPSISQ